MKKLTEALLLKGLWKIKPIHVVLFWLFMAYQAWMGSPYFMYYVVGAPEPGTAPRYVGKLRVEGRTADAPAMAGFRRGTLCKPSKGTWSFTAGICRTSGNVSPWVTTNASNPKG
jgi:hypothetical protein